MLLDVTIESTINKSVATLCVVVTMILPRSVQINPSNVLRAVTIQTDPSRAVSVDAINTNIVNANRIVPEAKLKVRDHSSKPEAIVDEVNTRPRRIQTNKEVGHRVRP